MYRVLVIGCGGSGAKTLAYMMDQLRADLKVYGIKEIPGCWQFLNVDTPLQEEPPASVAPVSRQGGRYVSCGVSSGAYRIVDEALMEDVQAQTSTGLRDLATWLPRRPQDVTVPLNIGAGQYRGIGRLVILTRLAEIQDAVRQAVEAMGHPDSLRAAEEVARRVPGVGTAPAIDLAPMVLVVSSMAGGSGASMTLDVCRLVAGTSLELGINPDSISVFLYTAEVFQKSVPANARQGMPGNTLAMLGEIVATQSGADGEAARVDRDLYAKLGVSVTAGKAFKRVTPIGLKAGGSGAVFGDGSSEGVFRGMGRGLARYIAGDAFQDYVSYDVANHIDVPNRDLVSWGVDPDNTAWSSFGYASLSTGRDRYAEYASQRLARRAVDHVMDGFRIPGDTTSDTQRLANLWQHYQGQELRDLGLPDGVGVNVLSTAGTATDQGVINWLLSEEVSQGVNRAVLNQRAGEAVATVMGQRPQADGMPVPEWGTSMAQFLDYHRPRALEELEKVAAALALQRSQEIAQKVVVTTRSAIARLGLPYASTVLARVREPGGVIDSLVPRLAALEGLKPANTLEIPNDLVTKMRAMAKAVLGGVGAERLAETVQVALQEQLYQWLAARTSVHLATALKDLSRSAIKPLQDTLEDASKVLRGARHTETTERGVANVATSFYTAWPAEPEAGQAEAAAVPVRFATAHNEVVLMPVSEYPGCFNEHVRDSVQPPFNADLHQAYAEAVREVVTGVWEQGADVRPPADLLTVATAWVPSGLQGATGGVLPTPARYELRLRPVDLLERSRAFVARRGESFEQFCSQSIRDYLGDEGVGDYERDQRSRAVLEGLKRTMEMARPLTEVNKGLYERLHQGTAAAKFQREYSFTPIPVGDVVTEQLCDYVATLPDVDKAELPRRIRNAAQTDAAVSRIDVFGSFSRTLPAAYSGILDSVKTVWDQAKGSPGARKQMWTFRRARPLAGGVPVGDADRRMQIRGWWVASLCGGLERPAWGDKQADYTPVRIWDREDRRWLDFPTPLLTPPSEMIVANALLPAVLESTLLAYLEVSQKGLEAFRPWTVMRRWAEAGKNDPERTFGIPTPVEDNLADLLATGTVDDLAPAVQGLEKATTPEERREVLLAYCDSVLAYLDQHYLPGRGKKDEPGWFTNYRRRNLVEWTPLTVDLAQEMSEELMHVRNVLKTLKPAGTEGPGSLPFSDGGMVF